MLSINNNRYELTLKAVTKKDSGKNSFIIKENFATTLISNEKTIYIYFENNTICQSTLKKAMIMFGRTNRYDCNIDLATFPLEEKEAMEAILDGLLYNSTERVSYKSDPKTKKVNYSISTKLANAKEILDKFTTIYKYKNLARDLQDMPPNKMYAEKFAEVIQAEAKQIEGLKVTILEQEDIVKNKMGMLLAVNAGSARDARVVILEWKGDPRTKETTALVGKGITFDTGGINLKPSFAMEGMKYDMSGAAIACATVLSLAKLKAKANVCAVGCLTENMIGSSATIVESIVTSMNGKTVEIGNTDAEGRLVVGDGVTYAIRKLKASKIIEMSTLTGAILIALGTKITGVFSNNDQFFDEFKYAAQAGNERIWRMPITKENSEELRTTTKLADIRNIGAGRNAGSSIAAAFIQEFVEDKPFIHLDIAGTATEGRSTTSGTGVMVRTLFEMFNK